MVDDLVESSYELQTNYSNEYRMSIQVIRSQKNSFNSDNSPFKKASFRQGGR